MVPIYFHHYQSTVKSWSIYELFLPSFQLWKPGFLAENWWCFQLCGFLNVRLDSTADFSLRINLALYALLHHFPARKMRGCKKKSGRRLEPQPVKVKIVWSCLQPGSITKGAWLHRDVVTCESQGAFVLKPASQENLSNFSAQSAEKPCCQTDMNHFVHLFWASCKSSCLITHPESWNIPNLTYEAMCPAIIALPCCVEAPVSLKVVHDLLLTNVEYNGI